MKEELLHFANDVMSLSQMEENIIVFHYVSNGHKSAEEGETRHITLLAQIAWFFPFSLNSEPQPHLISGNFLGKDEGSLKRHFAVKQTAI